MYLKTHLVVANFLINIVSGFPSLRSDARGDALVYTTVSVPCEFSITARDEFGNVCTGGGYSSLYSIELRDTSNYLISSSSDVTWSGQEGVYVGANTPPNTGNFVVRVLLGCRILP